MAETPFEHMLKRIGRDAVEAGDTVSVTLIAQLMAYVQQGRYAALGPQIEKLQPVYRSRLGVVPKSREEDLTMKPKGDRR